MFRSDEKDEGQRWGFDYYFCSKCAVLRKGEREGDIFRLSLGGRISDVALQKHPFWREADDAGSDFSGLLNGSRNAHP